MEEKIQLQNAAQELAISFKALNKRLNFFMNATVSYTNSRIAKVGNDVLEVYKELKSKIASYQVNRIIEKEEKKQEKETEKNRVMAEMMEEAAMHERTKEHVSAMKEILKEQDKAQREYQMQKRKQRLIQIRYGTVQKVKGHFLS